MNKLWKRSLSLLLALIMVVGYLPVNVLATETSTDPSSTSTGVETEEDHSLANAHGLIWLVKTEDGGASDAFYDKVLAGELDDMIRSAVGDTSGATVYYLDMDVGNALALALNEEKRNALIADLTASVADHELVTFKIGNKDVRIAFRNILTATVDVADVYIRGKGAPADLETQIENALNNPKITIKHIETIGLKMAGATISDPITHEVSWPEVGEPDAVVAEITVSIHAADDESVVVSDTGYVYLRETRHLYTVTYEGEGMETQEFDVVEGEATPTIENPTREYYTFVKWDETIAETVTEDVTYTAVWSPDLDVNGNNKADQEEIFTVTYTDGIPNQEIFPDVVYQVPWGGTVTLYMQPGRDYYIGTGWSPVVHLQVTQDAVYTATWKPKVDHNGNGIADQEEAFTITYYVKNENGENVVYETFTSAGDLVTPQPQTPPTKEGFTFAGWVDGNGNNMDQKVSGNAEYYASWTTLPIVTYVVKFADGSEQSFVASTKTDYTVVQPANIGDTDTTIWSGWLDANNKLFDFNTKVTNNITLHCYFEADENNNGEPDGTIYDPYITYVFMHANGEVMQTIVKLGFTNDFDVKTVNYPSAPNDGQIFLGWIESKGTVEGGKVTYTYTPNIVADRNNNDVEDGNAADPYVYYIFLMDDGSELKKVEWLAGDPEVNPENVSYPVTGNQNFEKWVETQSVDGNGYTVYTYTPVVIEDENGNGISDDEEIDKVNVSLESLNVTGTPMVQFSAGKAEISVEDNGVTYTGTVKIDGLMSDGTFTYTIGTPIEVTPLWNADKTVMAAYVAGIKVDGEPLPLTYDGFTAIYQPIATFAATADEPKSVNLEIQYEFAVLELVANPQALELGKSYTKQEIYNQVISAPAYDAEAVTLLYKARDAKDNVSVDLTYLYGQLDANIVSAIKGYIGGDSITVSLDEKWLSVDAGVQTKSVKDVADEFIDRVLAESAGADGKPDINLLLPKARTLVNDLKKEINAKADLRKFGAITDENATSITEVLDVTYENEKLYIYDSVNITLMEIRKTPSILVHNAEVTYTYGKFIDAQLLANVQLLDENGSPMSGTVKLSNDRYTKLGVGTHTVTVVFDETATYKGCSTTFTLEIVKDKPIITINDIRVEQGERYDPTPFVTPAAADIVHVIAGVELEGQNIDLVNGVLNKDLGKIDVKAWIKLPSLYVKVIETLGMVKGTYTLEQIREKLAGTSVEDPLNAALESVNGMLLMVENVVETNLGVNTEFVLNVTFDPDSNPTAPGFYLNYAQIMDTTNYDDVSTYGTIVITPFVAIPNHGNVQLVYSNEKDAQNVFTIEHDGKAKNLRVTHNGSYIDTTAANHDDSTIHYYGLTTQTNTTDVVPTQPGIYVATVVYTVKETDVQTNETVIKQVGSDVALIIVDLEKVTIDVARESVVYDGNAHLPAITVKDQDGKDIGAAVTVISGTAGLDNTDTNISLQDLTGNVNIDFPDKLDKLWKAFCNEAEIDVSKKIKPISVINFLNSCINKINNSIPEGTLLGLGVPADYIDQLQAMSTSACNALIEEIEKLPPDVSLSFYDVDDLNYVDTGVYLFAGIVTDPDLRPDANAGLLVIKSADTYVMYETEVPYNGKQQQIEIDDETSRDGITVIADRAVNEVSFKLDSDMTAILKAALERAGFTLNTGSSAYVGNVYTKGEAKFSDLQDVILAEIEDKATNRITEAMKAQYPELGELYEAALNRALASADARLTAMATQVSTMLQDLDQMPDDTLVIINGNYPVNVGVYEFYGFDYDIAYSSADLHITPIRIVVDDVDNSKFYGENDPELTANVTYFDDQGNEIDLPDGVTQDDVVTVTVTREDGNTVDTYDMTVTAVLVDLSGNYVLDAIVQDGEDFEIKPVEVTVTAVVNPDEVEVNETATLTITVTDAEGNPIELETKYVITNADGDVVDTLETALAQAGEYTITPSLVDNVNYISAVSEGTLTVNPITVYVHALIDGADSKEVTVGADHTALSITYVVKDAAGNVISGLVVNAIPNITDVEGNTVADLAAAVSTAGTYKITPENASVNDGNYMVADEVVSATLNVIEDTMWLANAQLGNSLALAIAFHDTDLTDVNGYYVVLTREFNDNRADEVETIFSSQWGSMTNGGLKYYYVTYNGIAAKEMADNFHIQVFNAQGEPVTVRYTESIRSYSMRRIDKETGKNKSSTLYVDLLNYGSAAQEYFTYNVEDKANRLLGDKQSYATDKVEFEAKAVEGSNYLKSNVQFVSNINFALMFQNIENASYAKVTYTDHYEKVKSYTIQATEFLNNGTVVAFATLSAADCYVPVTVTVYDANGAVLAYATDSLAGYAGRQANGASLYTNFLKYINSAYNYFHN